MTSDPKSESFTPIESRVSQVLGAAATALLDGDAVLIFEIETGLLMAFNPHAARCLGLDSDNPIQPAFSEMVDVPGCLPSAPMEQFSVIA